MGGPAPKSRTGLWIALAVVVVAALGGGGYYATAMRGPDPEMVKAQTAAIYRKAAVSGRPHLLSLFIEDLMGAERSPARRTNDKVA